jgi:hypothetical protein
VLTAKSPISTLKEIFSGIVPVDPSLIPLYKIHNTKILLQEIAKSVIDFLNSFSYANILQVFRPLPNRKNFAKTKQEYRLMFLT